MFTQARHSRTFTQLSLSIILSSRSVVYIIVVLGLYCSLDNYQLIHLAVTMPW